MGKCLLSWWLNTCHYTDRSVHLPLLFHNSDTCTAESSLDLVHPMTQIKWLRFETILWCQICEFCIYYSISCHFMHYLASRSVMAHLEIMYMLLLWYMPGIYSQYSKGLLFQFSILVSSMISQISKWTVKKINRKTW